MTFYFMGYNVFDNVEPKYSTRFYRPYKSKQMAIATKIQLQKDTGKTHTVITDGEDYAIAIHIKS